MKLALLGAGRIGKVHAANIHHHPQAQLVAVADVHQPSASELAQAYGAKAYPDADALFADKSIEGVLICTSTDTHVDMILKAARAKLPIFCEKPVHLDISLVNSCLAEVEKAAVPLVMGFNRRFDPNFKALRDALQRGDIGNLETVKITSRDPSPPPPSYVKVSGGLFRDMMIHDFDMARFLTGDEFVEVFAAASCLVDPEIGKAGDVDTAMVVMKTRKGALCHIDNSRRAVYGYDQRLEVHGSKGMLQAGNPSPTTVVRHNAEAVSGDKPPYFFLERYAEAYKAELQHFLDVANGKEKPNVTGKDGREALVLADAAALSLKQGKPVSL